MGHADNIKNLLAYSQRRLQKLKEQVARKGASVDPDVLIEIEDLEAKIGDLEEELHSLAVEPEPGSGRPGLTSLLFVTINGNKYREYETLLQIPYLKQSKILIVEPQKMALHALVEEKINIVLPQLPGMPFFVEHSGLIIDAWKGLPGGLTRQFIETVGNRGICKMMQGYEEQRSARAVAAIGFYHPDLGPRIFEDEVPGTIASEPRGQANFGWDPIFIPDRYTITYAEMTFEQKHQCSMRHVVADRFKHFLDQQFRTV